MLIQTLQFRWNKNKYGQMRLEQRCINFDKTPSCGTGHWHTRTEWRPIEVVEVGFDPTDFKIPLSE